MKKIFVLTFFLFAVHLLQAQEEKFKAIFMYNFTRYLEWPSSKQSGDFLIGVYGNSPIIDELNVIAQKKKVGSQQIVVKRILNIEELKKCNIVFVPENKSSQVADITQNCHASGVVLITDKPGLAKTYSCINYIQLNGKQNFEVNKIRLERQGIKINSALLSLGIPVE